MDWMESLNTLLEANAYLARTRREGGNASENPMLEEFKFLLDALAGYAKSQDIRLPAFDFPAYCDALERDMPHPSLGLWIKKVSALFRRIPGNAADARFAEFEHTVRASGEAALMSRMSKNYHKWREKAPDHVVEYFLNFMRTFPFWGGFDPQNGDFRMIEQRAKCLGEHIGDISNMYYALCDYRSRLTLLGLLEYWVDFDIDRFSRMRERHFDAYFDLDLIRCTPDEVFVDLGAYDGDTVLRYVANYGKETYKRIYCYEINRQNVKAMKTRLAGLKNVDIRRKGAADTDGTLYVEDFAAGDATRLREAGRSAVPVTALDSDIEEPITFLKMDIEGSEFSALTGAQRHITQDRPKMALSVYHSNDDLWRIFKLVYELCGDSYDYYFRFNAYGPEDPNQLIFAADYILLCVPRPARAG
jgi:FkbM family methyltransferase